MLIFNALYFSILLCTKKARKPFYFLFLLLMLFCSNFNLCKAILCFGLGSLCCNQFTSENSLLIYSWGFPVLHPQSLKTMQTEKITNSSNFIAWGPLDISVEHAVFLNLRDWLLLPPSFPIAPIISELSQYRMLIFACPSFASTSISRTKKYWLVLTTSLQSKVMTACIVHHKDTHMLCKSLLLMTLVSNRYYYLRNL